MSLTLSLQCCCLRIFLIYNSRALLALASGYLFTALIVIPHVLTFPGAFSPTGLLGPRDFGYEKFEDAVRAVYGADYGTMVPFDDITTPTDDALGGVDKIVAGKIVTAGVQSTALS